jgi:hypothetical protein
MAKISGIKKLLKSDLPNSPDWFSPVISVINGFLDTVIGALRGRLTFAQNFYCEIKEFSFTHGEELEILTGLPTYSGMLILKTPNDSDTDKAVDKWLVRQIKTNTLGVTVWFSGAGTTEGKVKFLILG